jgi:hypothetical protein
MPVGIFSLTVQLEAGRGKTNSKPLGLFNAKHFVFLLKIRQKEKPE